MSSDAVKAIAQARLTLVLDRIFWGCLATRLTLAESKKTQTMATDSRSLFYNADYVCTLTQEQLVCLVAHEVMHCALQHHVRRDGRDAERWNNACDYAVNPLLLEAGFTPFDTGWLCDQQYAGLSAEQIYGRLPVPAEQQQQDDEQQASDDQSEDESDGAGSSGDDAGSDDSSDDAESDSDDESESDDDSEDDAAGDGEPDDAAGEESDDEEHEQSHTAGAIFDAPDANEDAAEWQIAVQQAAQAATAMGDMPAGMASVLSQVKKIETEWRDLTRRFMQQLAAADYSWKRPNRRYVAQGIYLPELNSEAMGPIVLAFDSSGSTAPYVEKFIQHVQSIIDECQPEKTYVVMCDAMVHSVTEFERGESLDTNELAFAGGGGTSFVPVFEWLEREQIEPACVIYLTDGDGWYPAPSDIPTLWAMTGAQQAPWGESVNIEGALS